MTIHRRITVSCDASVDLYNKPCNSRLDLSSRTQSEARERVKAKGWHHINPSRDICPGCWEAGRR